MTQDDSGGSSGSSGQHPTAARPDGRRLRWVKHREERRRAVVEAAIAVIEEHPPGETVHVQEIADRAGIHRTVLYRHFEDRADLDLAVQEEICRRGGASVFDVLALDGTPREIVRRIVESYIRWHATHPALIRFVERAIPGHDGPIPLDQALEQVTDQVGELVRAYATLVGAELPQRDWDTLDPWLFGVIGGAFQATRRWTSRDLRHPDFDDFVELMTRNVWHQLGGVTRDRGIEVPDVPVEELLELLNPDGASHA